MTEVVQSGDYTATVRARVLVEWNELSPEVNQRLDRVVLDLHISLPGMFELWFADEGGILDQAKIKIGSVVDIYGGSPDDPEAPWLIDAEVTSIEAVCAELQVFSVVRGYETSHRLQRAQRTRTFVNMKDSDIAYQIMDEAGLYWIQIDDTSTTHEHLSQINQTDWAFLKYRAQEIGYETGCEAGNFYFRKATNKTDAGETVELIFKRELIEFRPRVTAANLTPEVEVRVWDPKAAQVVVGSAASETVTAKLDHLPADIATAFKDSNLRHPPTQPQPSGPSEFGSPPSPNAFLLANRPLATGSNTSSAADEVALGVAEHIASAFAEAEGYCVGNPEIRAGTKLKIDGVPAPFVGEWFVTQARHVFDENEEGGYMTRFWVSGRQDRSLLGLVLGATDTSDAPTINGLVCGIVTNVADPDKKGRIKVAMPWLAPSYESDWARVVQFGGGVKSGAYFTPEVGDEVLAGFEFGDPRRPYVLGGLRNDNTNFDLGGDAVKQQGQTGQVVKRGFVSSAGNRLVFDDDVPSGGGKPTKSEFVLGTKDDKLSFKVDEVGGKLLITCDPDSPTGTFTITCGKGGKLTIESGGTIDIKSGSGGALNVEAGGQLSLKGQAGVKIESSAIVEVKGSMIKLN